MKQVVAGVHNLLHNCMEAKSSDRLLIVRERGQADYYDESLAGIVANCARAEGLVVDLVDAPVVEDATDFPVTIKSAMEKTDHTLFLARIGDQLRFSELPGSGSVTMCYALDEQTLGSSYASAPYQFFVEFKHLINAEFWGGKEISITCPAGTSLQGLSPEGACSDEAGEVAVKRFPMNVFKPIPANTFSGKVALTKWLSITGSRFYQPDSVFFEDIVFAHVENGRIVDYEGNINSVDKINKHYEFVSERYGINPDIVHSWHAGIHPQNGYAGKAKDNLSRWSCAAFGNPRYLHFHTCGNYPPGEICWSVFDPTIKINNTPMWEEGSLVFSRSPSAQSLMDKYQGVSELFDSPIMAYGL